MSFVSGYVCEPHSARRQASLGRYVPDASNSIRLANTTCLILSNWKTSLLWGNFMRKGRLRMLEESPRCWCHVKHSS
ncbi:hypothetical protein C0J52_19212 [Blattella germanica]|nr:hypothetical protein C0J52_19212 [Blattella germanica]